MTKNRLPLFKFLTALAILFLLGATAFTPALAQTTATDLAPDAVAVVANADALTIVWPNPALARASTVDLVQQLPTVRFQGYLLPMQLLTIAIDEGKALDLQLGEIQSQPWEQGIEPASPLVPNAIDWETLADPTQAAEVVELPATPIFVLRQGMLHGQPIAVVAVSPLYAEAGVTKVATALSARALYARVVDPTAVNTTAQSIARPHSAEDATALGPVNPDAVRNAYKVLVTAPGMQQITGQMLAAAGFDFNTADPTRLQLHHNGVEVALQIEGLVGGKLSATSLLRFYAPQVGNRWNARETYWLAQRESAGLRMTSRSVAPGAAPVRSTALETGTWEAYQFYDSRYAGFDGDHWFHQKLSVPQAGASLESSTVSATLTPRLPRIADTALYTIAVTTNIRGQHSLRIKGNSEQQDITWNSVTANELVYNWQHIVSSTDQSNSLSVVLLSTVSIDGSGDATFLLDKIAWQVPVALNFGEKGAIFQGIAGNWRYQWSNLPAGHTFYDVTTPETPMILTGADTGGFQDGPTPHSYLVAGPDVLQTPTVVAHTPIAVTGISGADAIYLGPAQFLSGLEPLLQLRRDQGYQVTAVDVQAIYDGWSFGQVSAEGIRAFLRYAAANWQPAPRAVILVGDGTWDPHNYEKKDALNFIPPYLAKVDPWLIEAACEPCYAQLDGDDPLTGDDPTGRFFAADLWIGRLPVKNTGDLAGIVNKIVSYERATLVESWQNVSVFVADNYIKSVDAGGIPVKDLAGDFAKISDGIVTLSPSTIRNQRIYYDPYPQIADPNRTQSWRITNALQARDAVVAQLSAGAGLVTYNGHSHHWQWAVTDESPTADPNWLLGLYDTDALTNKNRYFVSLSMTCLTSQFQKPAFSGTVLDERLLLNANGGAVTIWGPAGLSVAYGHDLLQRGFHDALWTAPPLTAKMGALIEAGNTALLTQGGCCQDTLKTFLLLGDPLTTVRVYSGTINQLYLPLIDR